MWDQDGQKPILDGAGQAFKILRADSCTSDVETRLKFKKIDKYSWFHSIKWMEKSNNNTFWTSRA